MVVLRHSSKVKKGLGLVFGAHFQHDFSIKIFCIYSINRVFTLSMDKVSMSYLFSFPRYLAKCVFKFLFGQLVAS